jgi:phosphatidylglycerophosphatase A
MSYLHSRTQNAFGLFLRAGFPGKLAFVFASALGAGFLPVLPGTLGTLVGIPLVIGSACFGPLAGGVLIFLFIVLAVWSSDVSAKLLARKDPPEVVIDEVAGILVTLYLLPFSWVNLCLGFVLFRVFDILKPYPVRRLEKLRGGVGIVADDLLAGVYANLSLRLLVFFL